MGILFDSCFVDLFAVFVAIVTVFVTYVKWRYSYWSNRNLPYIQPKFPFGNMQNPFAPKINLPFALKDAYNEFRARGVKDAGFYNLLWPVYMPIDPDSIKNVTQTHFQHFVDRGIYHNEKDDPLSGHLFAIGGQKWKHIRSKLTPTFTSGKMKMMYNFVLSTSKHLEEEMKSLVAQNEPIDIKEMGARFTTDIIGSCFFGIDCNSFVGEEPEFRKCGKQFFTISKARRVGMIGLFAKPEIGRALGLKIMPKESSDFFLNVVKDAAKYRDSNAVVRNDMLQSLLELRKNEGDDGKPLTIEEVAAQAFAFFLAGFETSSSTMSYCLFELSRNHDIQQKVREEINKVLAKHDNKLTYESLAEMKYMEQVIDETLRMYPPLAHITRKCVKDYRIPGTDNVIEKGTPVFIPILGLHMDPEHHPDPERFDPERFSPENKKDIRPFTYIPFGAGPRLCIGLRFGMMQTKVGLTVLLRNFKFTLNKKTPIPLVIDPGHVVYVIKHAIWLDAVKV